MVKLNAISLENKKFLETDYPRGRAAEVFRRFHFGLKAKKRPEYSGLYFPHPELLFGSSDLSQGEVNRKPRGRASRNSLD